ncbi:unnamed protein product [Rotaria sp. Silwood2]|nr:unnamed protein product [Rotaria sp. Silwood2]CAF2930427.1 unnamed protein product [Rotaria sp. Silwood2]CAF3195284.1 unnamed protein product [Rotaria sp. Silwood2]CAF3299181.1 unnamed protein product [Rotaria sp. Silwood2]
MDSRYVTIGFLGFFFVFLIYSTSAYFIAQNLAADLEKAFRPINNLTITDDKRIVDQPFSISKLLQAVPTVSYRTLTYVTYDDTTLTLDYYESTVAGIRPCLIIIHGGAWRSGNSKQLPELNSHLARAGYHCAAINYRLTPQWKCPAPIEDTTAALNYLCKHADDLNIDTNNFILLGRSAGAQIALLTAYTLKHSGIKGVIDFYGPADMIWGYMVPTNPLVIDSRKTLATYIGGDYYEIPDKYAASSPIEFVNRQSVPTLVFHGLTDSLVFYEHSRRLCTKLHQHDVPHYLLELPWATHGFDYHLNGPGGQLSTFAIDYFLRVVTNRH